MKSQDISKKYAGIDYSMTSPSLTIIEGTQITSYFLTTKSKLLGEHKINDLFTVIGIEYPDYKNDTERFYKLAQIIVSKIPVGCKIAIEGYSFGSTGARLFQIGENTGVLKHMLMLSGHEFSTFAPTEVKKYATGKGNSKKDQMFDSFVRQTEFNESYIRQTFNQQGEIKSPLADIIDSYYIAKILRSQPIIN